jgi:hypothetical protein
MLIKAGMICVGCRARYMLTELNAMLLLSAGERCIACARTYLHKEGKKDEWTAYTHECREFYREVDYAGLDDLFSDSICSLSASRRKW